MQAGESHTGGFKQKRCEFIKVWADLQNLGRKMAERPVEPTAAAQTALLGSLLPTPPLRAVRPCCRRPCAHGAAHSPHLFLIHL